jgi:hypothetical protein
MKNSKGSLDCDAASRSGNATLHQGLKSPRHSQTVMIQIKLKMKEFSSRNNLAYFPLFFGFLPCGTFWNCAWACRLVARNVLVARMLNLVIKLQRELTTPAPSSLARFMASEYFMRLP